MADKDFRNRLEKLENDKTNCDKELEFIKDDIKIIKEKALGKIWLLIPIIISAVSVYFGYYQWNETQEVSKENIELTKQNQPLEFTSEMGVGGEMEIFEKNEAYTVEIPIKIKMEEKQGKTKARIFVMSNRENGEPEFINLTTVEEDEIVYSRTGKKEDIREAPIDFFIFYIDNQYKIEYEYHLLCPEYDFDELIKKGSMKTEATFYDFNKYEMISDYQYKKIIENYKENHKDSVLVFSDFKVLNSKINNIISVLKEKITFE